MTMLALAPPRIAISSFNLRRLTLGLPIAIGPPNPSPHRPLPKEAVNARRPRTAAAEIPIASDAPPRHTSRGFLPWRFAYAGPGVRRATIMGASIRKPSHIRTHAPRQKTSCQPSVFWLGALLAQGASQELHLFQAAAISIEAAQLTHQQAPHIAVRTLLLRSIQ